MVVGEETPSGWFQIRDREDPDGRVRLILIGHLDVPAVHQLARRLDRLRRSRRAACVDLSRLARIEPSGAETILSMLSEARRIGWNLEISFV